MEAAGRKQLRKGRKRKVNIDIVGENETERRKWNTVMSKKGKEECVNLSNTPISKVETVVAFTHLGRW